ncbi:LacI family DNA-binding transcriptional regulator [Bombiscardovia coagulans]|uniref:LacI family transcriptional regulator n=1 Tax=Bombiscardovia coagulans TaxID=686666 RepID=A0A261EQV0_9BIFI|nr:LacI family DNA-binding transcriptional regulator [Bombiscardovia coagulans]OZG49233.1 LacI family transcriptional regulator [Bombiscardovia coagulans]
MAGIQEVAKRAGVAMSTVSYVMSGKRSVSGETKLRVLQAARELGYYPNAKAKILRATGDVNILALSSPMHAWTYYTNYAAFFFGVANRARQHGYEVLLLMDEDGTDELQRISDSGLVDGAVLLDVAVNDSRVEMAKTTLVPMVSIGISSDHSSVISVDLDFEQMAKMAVNRALILGHKHILMVGSGLSSYENGSNFLIRTRDSVKHYAACSGMQVSFYTAESSGRQWAEGLLDRAFESDPDISALFAQCGLEQLESLLSACQARGLRVPYDLSVLALGTLGNAANMTIPIDEIPMLPFAVGGRAVEILLDMLAGKCKDVGTVETIPSKYLKRGSMVPFVGKK